MDWSKVEITRSTVRNQLCEVVKERGLELELYHFIRVNDTRQGNRLAWVLGKLLEEHREWFAPLSDDLLEWLPGVTTQGIVRSFLRAVAMDPPPKSKESDWIDFCFSLFNDPQVDIAVRVHALQILHNYCRRYPDLSHELESSIHAQMPYLSTGLKNRAKKVLKSIEKQ